MKKLLIILPLLFLALQSCQDVIDIDLIEGEKRIIINGRITDSLPVEVNIYVTADYLSTQPNPTVKDAEVELYEDGILVATLVEVDSVSGLYTAAFVGSEGKTYQIKVHIPEGHPYFPNTNWESHPEEMYRVAPIDSSYSKFYKQAPFVEEGYYAFCMFTDPAGKGDNYRFRLWKNDTLFDSQYDLTVFQDEFFDGKSFNNKELPALQLGGASKIGDTYKLEMSSISYEGFKFIELLSQQTVQVGSTFDPPPAPIFGNIVNSDDPNILGLGYFFASKLSFVEVTIQE